MQSQRVGIKIAFLVATVGLMAPACSEPTPQTAAATLQKDDASAPNASAPVLACATSTPPLCSIAGSYTLCFTLPGDSKKKSECLWDWHDDSPQCAPGYAANTPCKTPAAKIEDVCHKSGPEATVDYACFCNETLMIECHRFDEL